MARESIDDEKRRQDQENEEAVRRVFMRRQKALEEIIDEDTKDDGGVLLRQLRRKRRSRCHHLQLLRPTSNEFLRKRKISRKEVVACLRCSKWRSGRLGRIFSYCITH